MDVISSDLILTIIVPYKEQSRSLGPVEAFGTPETRFALDDRQKKEAPPVLRATFLCCRASWG